MIFGVKNVWIKTNMAYKNLTKTDLQNQLEYLKADSSGSKKDLIRRLGEMDRANSDLEDRVEVEANVLETSRLNEEDFQKENLLEISPEDSASNISRFSKLTTSSIRSLRAKEAENKAGLMEKVKAL